MINVKLLLEKAKAAKPNGLDMEYISITPSELEKLCECLIAYKLIADALVKSGYANKHDKDSIAFVNAKIDFGSSEGK